MDTFRHREDAPPRSTAHEDGAVRYEPPRPEGMPQSAAIMGGRFLDVLTDVYAFFLSPEEAFECVKQIATLNHATEKILRAVSEEDPKRN